MSALRPSITLGKDAANRIHENYPSRAVTLTPVDFVRVPLRMDFRYSVTTPVHQSRWLSGVKNVLTCKYQ